MKKSTLSAAVLLLLNQVAVEPAQAATAPESGKAEASQLDSVIVTGTRGSNRTQFETLVPVDVISRDEIRAVASPDLNDVLAQLVPSFVVQRLPMADGLVFVRPATMRGLSPGQTLVLVNGRRFHRSALLGGNGAQAADLAQIPTVAISRIEVLRDGASAQYGSDAIAGVINIILDETLATELSLRYSRYSEGDGAGVQFSAKTGFAIGESGALVLFADLGKSDATSRTRQRPDAITFQSAHPELNVPNPVQHWGQPDLKNKHVGFNLTAAVSTDVTLYSHALYGTSEGLTDFNWRNPDTTTGAFKASIVFPGWDLRSIYPTGFSPKYSNEQRDMQWVAGLRGQFSDNFSWDLAGSLGFNRIDYKMGESINASMGPASPTKFYLGQLAQEERSLSANFNRELSLEGLSQPVNIAFGTEIRNETYGVKVGDAASFAVGPGAVTGLDANSNGAPGFSERQAGKWGQDSYAAFLDVEVPVTQRLRLGAAGRYENFSEFGSTLDGKLSSRFELTPGLALRGSYSTGFRAPTPGQLHATSTTQGLDTKTLQVFTNGRLSPTDPLAILLGAKPLTPEKSNTLSLGMTWKTMTGLSGSLDLYDVKLNDRFSTSASSAIPAGVANPMKYSSVNFFTNDFDTTTRGLDLVGNYLTRAGSGRLNLTVAYNYNITRVDAGKTSVATNATQRKIFEERLPQHKATLGASYDISQWSLLARLRHYGAWTDSSGNATGDIFQRFGAMQFLDLAASYKFNNRHSLRVGIDNVLNKYPDEATFQASRGLVYSRNAPYDTDGRNLFAEYKVKF